jgi:hypothetical protein
MHMHVVDGIDMAPELQIELPSLDEFVAQLTEAAYPIALRHACYGLISICAAGVMAGAFLLTRE